MTPAASGPLAPEAPPASGAVSTTTARILLANLVAQSAIIITGGLVRLTGSGLGCPTWPECVDGSLAPTTQQEEEWHKYVEFGNRLLTFVLVIVAVAALVAVWRHRPRRRALLLLAATPFLGTIAQAVLGGITVLTGLNPWTVAAHFLVSIGLVAAATVLYWRGREPGDGPAQPRVQPPIRALTWLLVAVCAAVVVVGTLVTGSGPHSGDAEADGRMPFDVRTVAWLHADLVLLFLGLLVGVIVALVATAAPADVRRASLWVLGVALAQGALGYTQYFVGVPWLLVLVHITGAVLLWIMVLRLLLTTRSRGVAISASA